MTVLLLIVVIIVLVLVHEVGHFIAAKLTDMRVDEFGLGYPPRAATLAVIGETRYTLNWIPFGGFVKIYGEDASRGVPGSAVGPRAFGSKNRFVQAVVLVAGITMNLVFAYVLITGALIMGTPRALTPHEVADARDVELAIAYVLPESPAARAGLLPGDTITSAVNEQNAWRLTPARAAGEMIPESFTDFIVTHAGKPVLLSVVRNGTEFSITAEPTQGVVADEPTRYALGVEVVTIGVVPLSLSSALVEGAILTWGVLRLTAEGLARFFYDVFTLSANFSQVTGPVGIAGMVGMASTQGFGNLFSLVAIISINLALINLVPIPALDGGRLLFVFIESVTRRSISPRIAQALNSAGFAFLIFLMLAVTVHDIFRIVG